jgi:hypothetical protein
MKATWLAIALVALAGSSAMADDSQPFHFELDGYPHLIPTLNPCLVKNAPTASGTATDMGPVTFTANESIHLCTLPNSIDSDYTLTAADGDTVGGHIHVVQTVDLATLAIVYVGTFTITHGTGAFTGATGGGDYTVSFPVDQVIHAYVTGDGVISY